MLYGLYATSKVFHKTFPDRVAYRARGPTLGSRVRLPHECLAESTSGPPAAAGRRTRGDIWGIDEGLKSGNPNVGIVTALLGADKSDRADQVASLPQLELDRPADYCLLGGDSQTTT